jgi:hypothetical protein
LEGLVPTSSSDNCWKRLLNSITMQTMMGASPIEKVRIGPWNVVLEYAAALTGKR